MGRYIQQRLLISIPVLLLITVIAFLLLQAAPGDPLNAYIPPDAPLPEEQREALRLTGGQLPQLSPERGAVLPPVCDGVP